MKIMNILLSQLEGDWREREGVPAHGVAVGGHVVDV